MSINMYIYVYIYIMILVANSENCMKALKASVYENKSKKKHKNNK